MNVNQLLGQIIISILTSSTVTALAVWMVQRLLEHRLSILSKTTESQIQRLGAMFDNALAQAKSVHSLCALLRKKVAFVFDHPLDQPRKYTTAASLRRDLEESFQTLEVDFQQARVNLMLLDEELFEELHQLKNAYGFIIRRTIDLVESSREELTLEQLHQLMDKEEGCNAMYYDAESLFHRVEPRLAKMVRKLGG